MAKDRGIQGRRRSRKHPRSQRRHSGGARWIVVTLAAVLLAGAIGWYFRTGLHGSQTKEPTISRSATKTRSGPTGKVRTPPESPDRFEFYDLLPGARVQVPEQPRAVHPEARPPVSEPGTYVIQAGAFPDIADADRVKKKLALLGVASEIQQAEANGVRFHRVRIGPIENLDELNRLRARLRTNHIDFVVTPVGD